MEFGYSKVIVNADGSIVVFLLKRFMFMHLFISKILKFNGRKPSNM